MLIKIQVTPNAHKNEILEETANFIRVKIAAPPIKGKANKELVKFLANYFKVKKSAIKIKSGLKSKNKIVQIQLEKK